MRRAWGDFFKTVAVDLALNGITDRWICPPMRNNPESSKNGVSLSSLEFLGRRRSCLSASYSNGNKEICMCFSGLPEAYCKSLVVRNSLVTTQYSSPWSGYETEIYFLFRSTNLPFPNNGTERERYEVCFY